MKLHPAFERPFAVGLFARPASRDRLCRRFGFVPFRSSLTQLGWAPALVATIGLTSGLMPTTTRAAATGDFVVVYSSVSPWYHRTPLAGGGFKPETYAFGEGGFQSGDAYDASADRLKFIDVAHIMANALATQNYLPPTPPDPKQTDLLIMVYWGTTIGTDNTSSGALYKIAQSMIPPPRAPTPTEQSVFGQAGPRGSLTQGDRYQKIAEKTADDSALQQSLTLTEMANRVRDKQDAQNAAILGYSHEMKRLESYTSLPLLRRRQDVVDEIEESRYYVVLLAYDFRELQQHKLKKLLWVTRFSISERHHDFSEELTAMAQAAAHSLGQDTGLKRRPLPATRVEMGELKSLGPER